MMRRLPAQWWPMRHWPMRWRLMIWNAALVVATFVIVGAAVLGGLWFFLFMTFNDNVRNQAGLAAAAVQIVSGKPTLPESAITGLRNRDHFIRLIAADGTLIIDTSRAPGSTESKRIPIAVDQKPVQKALAGQSTLALAHSSHGTMVYETIPIRDGGTIVGVIQVGVSRDATEDLLKMLAAALVVATPVSFLIAIGGGYLLASRALRPVDQITRLAAGIGANDLGARLALDLPDDELGRLSRTFDEMLGRIERAFEQQRRFTGDAAHELRTPLSLMQSQVDLALVRPRTSEEYQAAFRELEVDLTRLTRLVEALLALARSDEKTLAMERGWFDLNDTLSLVVDQESESAQEHGVTLCAATASAPLFVLLDEDLVIHLLINLVENALGNTPAGGRVDLAAGQEAGSVWLRVRDTGIGIAKEHQERIFERFYRVDLGRSRARGGSGLGLAICRAIVEAHEGTISLTSEPGKGTTIDVRFPRPPVSLTSLAPFVPAAPDTRRMA